MRNKRFIAAAAIAGMLVGVPAASAAGSKLITGSDVKNGSLTAKDISPNTLESWKAFFKGDTGPMGPIGPMGPQGERGLVGPQGAKGANGGNGLNGEAGADGADGKQGPVGPAGKDGVNGDKGDTGAAGTDGVNGKSAYDLYAEQRGNTMTLNEWLASHKGAKGDTGADSTVAGPKGDTGAQGPEGPQGPAGKNGAGLPGPKGATGDAGKNGISGYAHNLKVVSITNATLPTTVNCPAGKIALSGSGMTSGAGTGAVLSLSFPDFGPNGDTPPSGWTFKYTNVVPGPTGAKATFAVICADAS